MKYKLTIDYDSFPTLWEDNGMEFKQNANGEWYRPDDATSVTVVCMTESHITPYIFDVQELDTCKVYSVEIEVNISEGDLSTEEKEIVVKWVEEQEFGYGTAMRVIKSTHDRFTVGSRFDYGFFNIATREGYTIISLPMD